MPGAGLPDSHRIAGEERRDVVEMLADGDLVAMPLVALVPLVVVVKHQRDDVVEIIDEAVRQRRIDQLVEAIVEIGKIMEALVDVAEQVLMLAFHGP